MSVSGGESVNASVTPRGARTPGAPRARGAPGARLSIRDRTRPSRGACRFTPSCSAYADRRSRARLLPRPLADRAARPPLPSLVHRAATIPCRGPRRNRSDHMEKRVFRSPSFCRSWWCSGGYQSSAPAAPPGVRRRATSARGVGRPQGRRGLGAIQRPAGPAGRRFRARRAARRNDERGRDIVVETDSMRAVFTTDRRGSEELEAQQYKTTTASRSSSSPQDVPPRTPAQPRSPDHRTGRPRCTLASARCSRPTTSPGFPFRKAAGTREVALVHRRDTRADARKTFHFSARRPHLLEPRGPDRRAGRDGADPLSVRLGQPLPLHGADRAPPLAARPSSPRRATSIRTRSPRKGRSGSRETSAARGGDEQYFIATVIPDSAAIPRCCLHPAGARKAADTCG